MLTFISVHISYHYFFHMALGKSSLYFKIKYSLYAADKTRNLKSSLGFLDTHTGSPATTSTGHTLQPSSFTPSY